MVQFIYITFRISKIIQWWGSHYDRYGELLYKGQRVFIWSKTSFGNTGDGYTTPSANNLLNCAKLVNIAILCNTYLSQQSSLLE